MSENNKGKPNAKPQTGKLEEKKPTDKAPAPKAEAPKAEAPTQAKPMNPPPPTPAKADDKKVEAAPSKPAAASKPDEKKPEAAKPAAAPQPANKTAAPKQPEKKGASALPLLSLIIALAAAGGTGYNYLQMQKQQGAGTTDLQQAVQAAEAQALAAEKRANEIGKTVDAMQTHVANQAQGLDKSEVSQLIASALSDFAQNQPAPASAGLSQTDVEQMIQTAIAAQQSATPSEELTQMMASIKQANQNAQNALEQLNTRAAQIQQQLDSQAKQLSGEIASTAAGQAKQLSGELASTAASQANPQPLITALTLAGIAAQDGNYATADKYLGIAQDSFAAYHLDGTAFAKYQSQVDALRADISKLAGQGNTISDIDNIINTLPAWTFKKTNTPQAKEPSAESTQADTAAQTAENVATRILHRTFTVVHNDDAGLTWINAHPDLQLLIRENVRLDLAFARNALQLHDAGSYNRTIDSLIPRIQQYFDSNDPNVKNALENLAALKARADVQAPDIGALAREIAAAVKE